MSAFADYAFLGHLANFAPFFAYMGAGGKFAHADIFTEFGEAGGNDDQESDCGG